jgi:cytochrome b
MTRTSTMDGTAHGPAQAAAPSPPARTRRVVDAPVRMFHALFALSFFGAYLTAESERFRALHVTLGYTLAGLLAFRVLYGLLGPRPAGLALMWRKLGGAPAWLRSMATELAQRRPPGWAGLPWRQGQNLLMALAVLALLALALPLTLSGIAGHNEWGGRIAADALEEVHEFFGHAMLAVVLLHVALVVALGVLRRRNMALPMFTGRTEGAGPDLVTRNRAGLAALVLLAVVAFGAWQWQAAPQGLLPAATDAGDRHHGQGGRAEDDDDD